MVFQKPNPFPAMSICDNVISGLRLAGIKHSDKDALVESCLRRAGLWREVSSRLGAPGGSLSGGQQQRLCIARSLAVAPDVVESGPTGQIFGSPVDPRTADYVHGRFG
jgi:phosphate transport system ATP-binding protein